MTDTTTQAVTAMLPCPFCGNKKATINTKAKGYFLKKSNERAGKDTSNYLVRCTKCGAKGPLSQSNADAITAWGARVPDAALAAQLAAALDKLELERALTDGAHARAREASLDALAAYGQAADAHAAQLAAEAKLATARAEALEEAARVCDEMHNDWRRTDVQDAAAAIRALAKGES